MTTTTIDGGATRRRRGGGDVYPQFLPKTPVTQALGALLRERRETAGRTIKDMTVAVGCGVNAWRMYESGASSMRSDMLLLAARELGIEPAELLAIDPNILDQPAA